MKKASPIVFIIAGLAGLFLYLSVFTVDETERALILQLGKPIGDVRQPGIHFKIPWLQKALYFDVRVQEYDAPPADTVTADKKNLVVDNYSRWMIFDPLLFFRTVRNISSGRARLDDIIYSELRREIGLHDLNEIVSEKRGFIMEEVTKKSNLQLNDYGIRVLDVRIKRADLPPQNQKAIFSRMRAERERQAKQYRSEGREQAQLITTSADKERTIMLAEANKQSEILRGEGDAQATKIYANALNRSPSFYEFVRSLDAYKKSFKEDTRMVLTPDSEFLKYLR